MRKRCGGEREGKAGAKTSAVEIWMSWTKVNQWWSPEMARWWEKQAVTFASVTKCSGYRITGCASSGVKLAGQVVRRWKGTSEVIIALSNPSDDGGSSHLKGLRWDNGGRPNRNRDETAVTGVDRRVRLVWFQNSLQPAMGWLTTMKRNRNQ